MAQGVKCLSPSLRMVTLSTERVNMGFSVGIVGKPSSGKTSFTNAACMTDFKVGSYPFTTIDANVGVTHVRTACACRDFGVQDNPKNSICVDGVRLVPIKLIDVAGLVPGAQNGPARLRADQPRFGQSSPPGLRQIALGWQSPY